MGFVNPERKRIIHKLLTRKYGLGVSVDSLDYITTALAESDDSFIHEILERVAQLFLNLQEAEDKLILDLERTKAIFSKIRSSLSLEAALLNKDNELEENKNVRIPYVAIGKEEVHDWKDLETFKIQQYFRVHDAFSGKNGHIEMAIPDISMKRVYYKNIYDILVQRVMRSEFIRTKTILNRGHPPITKIGSLKGLPTGSHLLLGMLMQPEEDKIHLDDLTASIELSFNREFEMTKNVFTLNSIVLVEGILTDSGKVIVAYIGMPTIPPINESSWINNWACDLKVRNGTLNNSFQKLCSDVYIIILSDVWLDSPEVLCALNKMFSRLSIPSVARPYAIIMCGNFSSKGYSYSSTSGNDNYAGGFLRLANMFKNYENLSQNTHFVFIPGSSDPWCPDFLPRPCIPKTFTQPLQKRLKNAHFSSNPSRIFCFFQNILVFRKNMISTLCQNAILPPKFSNDYPLELVVSSTVLNQSNLSPLPLSSSPILWGSKNCLSIDPIPDVLILADSYECYVTKYQGVICVNPGSFMNSGFSFATYQLYNKQCIINKVDLS